MTRARAVSVRIEPASVAHEKAFLAAVRRSSSLHHPWITAPRTSERFQRYVSQHAGERHLSYFAFSESGDLVGVINVSEIVRGVFQSAYLGYCAFIPHQGRGYMSAALQRVVAECFGTHRLHRLEANIQPENERSIQLVKRLGFRKEGYSERYLKVGGRWRDHERWAMTSDMWAARARRRATTRARRP
jgi:ribosomal-protein-alanine N-acetyltransferase